MIRAGQCILLPFQGRAPWPAAAVGAAASPVDLLCILYSKDFRLRKKRCPNALTDDLPPCPISLDDPPGLLAEQSLDDEVGGLVFV